MYAGQHPTRSSDELLALAKLRAIELRVGVGILGVDSTREMIKTNRYKNIQRFVAHDGVFGLNAEFLGSLRTTATANSTLGIPREWFDEYMKLL